MGVVAERQGHAAVAPDLGDQMAVIVIVGEGAGRRGDARQISPIVVVVAHSLAAGRRRGHAAKRVIGQVDGDAFRAVDLQPDENQPSVIVVAVA